jgi:hypothetical protein
MFVGVTEVWPTPWDAVSVAVVAGFAPAHVSSATVASTTELVFATNAR